MWALLERDLEPPHLQPLKRWFDSNVPDQYRREPWRHAA
jgi:hypothetical protein